MRQYHSLLITIAATVRTLSAAAAASSSTQVAVDTCNNAGHGQEEICTAHWTADGRSYHGNITWASPVSAGTTLPGRYVPGEPAVVYSGATPYLDGLSVMAGTFLLAVGPLTLYLYRRYRKDSRIPYLAALTDAARC
jgi:hypothetical protein